MMDDYGCECQETVAELRRELEQLKAWKAAVPVRAITLMQRNFRPGSINELNADSDTANWLATLPAPEAQT